VSFLGARLTRREQLAAMWFGPKGFASVVYGLLVIAAGIPAADEVFALVALTIVVSIVAHSSTDIVVARGFAAEDMPSWRQRWKVRGRRIRRRVQRRKPPAA